MFPVTTAAGRSIPCAAFWTAAADPSSTGIGGNVGTNRSKESGSGRELRFRWKTPGVWWRAAFRRPIPREDPLCLRNKGFPSQFCVGRLLFESFVDLDVALQNVGEKLREANPLAFGLFRKILPYASLNRSWQEDCRLRWNMMIATCGLSALHAYYRSPGFSPVFWDSTFMAVGPSVTRSW